MKVAQQLKTELDKLQNAIQKATVRSVVEHYMDPLGPLNALEKAASAPPGISFCLNEAFVINHKEF